MGRYVVVEFLDNDEAQGFIDEFHTEWARLEGRARVSGLFVRPGRACTCWDAAWINHGDKNRQFGITRGEKFGWWVCDRCGKPRKAGHQLRNQLTAADLNELPQSNSGYELLTEQLLVGSIATDNIPKRPKHLRLKPLLKRIARMI